MLPRHFLYNFICAFRSLARPGLLAIFVLYPCFSETSLSCTPNTRHRTRNLGKMGVQDRIRKCPVPLFFCISLSCTLDLSFQLVSPEASREIQRNVLYPSLSLFPCPVPLIWMDLKLTGIVLPHCPHWKTCSVPPIKFKAGYRTIL